MGLIDRDVNLLCANSHCSAKASSSSNILKFPFFFASSKSITTTWSLSPPFALQSLNSVRPFISFVGSKGRIIQGHLTGTYPVLHAAYTKANLDPKSMEDMIAVGNVLPPGGGASTAISSSRPIETSLDTINRQCSSGLSAINQIARVGHWYRSRLNLSLLFINKCEPN